jgi:hypothetical protein
VNRPLKQTFRSGAASQRSPLLIYERTPADLRRIAHDQDSALQQRPGTLMGIAGKPVQVRNPEAATAQTTDGPFLSSPLPVAGFAVIEAADLAEAVALVSRTPCAIANGVVEVWPLQGPT